MRILFLTYSYERGLRADSGGFRKLWELARGLKHLGNQVLVLYPNFPGYVPATEVACSGFPSPDLPILRPLVAYICQFVKALRASGRTGSDIVYYRTGLNVLPLLLRPLRGSKLILEVNADTIEFLQGEGAGAVSQRVWRLAEGMNVRGCNAIIALTPGLKRMVTRRYGVPGEKVWVVPSGTDPHHFSPEDVSTARRRIGLQTDGPVVGFIGLFYRHQGVHTLLEAMKGLREKCPHVRALIVGDGIMRPAWEATAKRLGVQDVVQFTGQVPYGQVPAYVNAMDVVATPFTADRGETSPFKILDALACARPVISSDLPCVRELAERTSGVVLVPPDDPSALAAAAEELIRDPVTRQRLGREGRAVVERDFAWSAIAEEVSRVIPPHTGRSTTKSSALGRTARAMYSHFPVVGLKSKPDRPSGLTAIVRIRDEQDWLEPCLLSIATVADQILVGDNGSRDGTPEILHSLADRLGTRLEVFSLPNLDILGLTNELLRRARYRWVIRWDADFVAHTDGPHDIRHFRTWLLSHDARRYFMVYPRMVELAGDLLHQDPAHPTRSDAHCFVVSPSLSYVYDRAGYEAPKVPRWYRVDRFDTPCFVHVNVKSDERLFRSYLWKQWLTDGSRAGGEPFEHYLHRKIGDPVKVFQQAAHEWAQAYFRTLRPLDARLLPRHPSLLVPYLTTPKYRLIYQNGSVIRRDCLEVRVK
jgi:glycosyltransferase involved in cell wall biosynthesis